MKFKVGDHVMHRYSNIHLGEIIKYDKVQSDKNNEPTYTVSWINAYYHYPPEYDHSISPQTYTADHLESSLREIP